MPLVTLPNHKTVEISLDIFLLSDQEYDRYIQELMSMDAGSEIDSFSYNSSLEDVNRQEFDEIDEIIEDIIDPELFLRDDI